VAEKLLAVYPPVIETVPESRRFVERAVIWVAGQGITQFIDLGAGLPTSPNTHVTAQEASPAATVAYVDNDPVVISHLTALLAHHSDRIAVISGDLRDRDVILGAPGLRAVIDLSKPRCTTIRRRISRRSSVTWRSCPPDWATRGGSVPAGASSRRRPSDPTG